LTKSRHSLGGSGFDDLLLEVGWLGVTKGNLVSGELVVTVGNCGTSVLHDLFVEWVKENFLVSLSIHCDSFGSSSDV